MKILFSLFVLTSLFAFSAFFFLPVFWIPSLIFGLCFLAGLYDYLQPKHSIKRNFPLMGRSRYIAEWFRPKVYQYFIESDTEGTPFSRIFRSIVYQRAKDVLDTHPFGTRFDVYEPGYEWMNHSIAAKDHHKMDAHPKVSVGGPDCKHPYVASIFNVSAMSYGSISKNAILALNAGALKGGFALNTGEGGISPHHLQYGGDLIYQLGTGYFGSRDANGGFSDEKFAETVNVDSVKMIELKLSQGAKPGHGGILPARKVTPEIARIRNIPMGKDVLSPPCHSTFDSPEGLLQFIGRLRDLSGGKPVGFKLCIGNKSEFLAICKAMIKTGIKPDFISIDGGEGGTGAAPLEFSNSVGMPMREALAFAYDALIGFDLKKDIQLIASGKVVTGFHLFRAFALGADLCYSARAMMMAIGCIQALECNKNTCPTGVATQNPSLMRGLVVPDKAERVAEYHKETVESFVELLAASGHEAPAQINRSDVYRRVSINSFQRYDEIYPYITKGCLLKYADCPQEWLGHLAKASVDSFLPQYEENLEN